MVAISGGLDRAESGEDQRVTLAAVNAISAMVAPVVLLSVGSVTTEPTVENKMTAKGSRFISNVLLWRVTFRARLHPH
jgi:hypothetical protein